MARYTKSLDHTLLALSHFNNAKHCASPIKAKKMISAGIKHLTKAAEADDCVEGIEQLEEMQARAHRVRARRLKAAEEVEQDFVEDDVEDEVDADLDEEVDINDEVEAELDDELDAELDDEDEVDASLRKLSARLRRGRFRF